MFSSTLRLARIGSAHALPPIGQSATGPTFTRLASLSLVGLSIAGSALLGGCKETVSSENIRTAGISMKAEVTAVSSSSSHVKVTLTVGGDESNTYVVLDSGDELIAEADGDEKTMEEVSDGIYEAHFDIADEGTEFRVKLMRDEDDDATGNSGTLPAPFRITSDLGEDPISRDDDIVLSWDPSGSDDKMELAVDDEVGEGCIFSDTFLVPGDRGSFTLEGGELDGTSGNDETCEITLSLSRSRRGVHDAKLDDESTFSLQQVRSTSATSAP